MIKKCGPEVDVLIGMDSTLPVSQLEILALNASADLNTTHHPNVENNGTRSLVAKQG